MSRIRIYGDTSGYIELKGPDVGNNGTLELPNDAVASQEDLNNLKNTVSDVEAIAILGL